MSCMVLLASTLCCPLMIQKFPSSMKEVGFSFICGIMQSVCLVDLSRHVDEVVAQFLHAMLLIRSHYPLFGSTFQLVNVYLVLLVYSKDKAALALRPELVIDICNLSIVKFLAGHQFGGNLGNSGCRTGLSKPLHICTLSLRSGGSGCYRTAWPLGVSAVRGGLQLRLQQVSG